MMELSSYNSIATMETHSRSSQPLSITTHWTHSLYGQHSNPMTSVEMLTSPTMLEDSADMTMNHSKETAMNHIYDTHQKMQIPQPHLMYQQMTCQEPCQQCSHQHQQGQDGYQQTHSPNHQRFPDQQGTHPSILHRAAIALEQIAAAQNRLPPKETTRPQSKQGAAAKNNTGMTKAQGTCLRQFRIYNSLWAKKRKGETCYNPPPNFSSPSATLILPTAPPIAAPATAPVTAQYVPLPPQPMEGIILHPTLLRSNGL